MSGLFGMISSFLGGGSIAGITFAGILVVLIFRPERISKPSSFHLATFLLIGSIAIPALLVLLGESSKIGGGIFMKLLIAASTICTAGAVYFLIDSLTGQNR